MKLILVRHGETMGNLNRIHEGGRRHGKLSVLGKKQVQKLGERLKDMTFDYIYSSDLRRARQTLAAIKKHHRKTPVVLMKELREVDVGSFTGKGWDETDWSKPPKNLESEASAKKRAKIVLDKAYRAHPHGTVLFVAHGFLNKALIKIITADEKDHPQHNTAVNMFEISENNKHKVHLINCTMHLSAKEKSDP